MKFHNAFISITLSGIALAASSAYAGAATFQGQNVANLLGWVSAPQANLCRGYFSQPEELGQTLIPGPFQQSPVKITFTGVGAIYSQGESTIQQNVEISQPGRIAKADKAVIYRNPQGGIDYIRLQGHVQVREPGKLVAGPYTVIRFDQHTVEAGPSVYHLYEDPKYLKLPGLIQPYDAWGSADHIMRSADNLIHLRNATYTTCAPTYPSWQISAGKITLDQQSGFGTAYNMWLRFYDIPVLYVPLYSFPIDNRRKSGFLTPSVAYQGKDDSHGTGKPNGIEVALPYYWNLAPNYDLTTTPKYIETRGFQLNSQFRYLISPNNDGQIFIGIVPDDPAFADFRNETLANPPPMPPGVSITPYLNALENDNNFRAFAHMDHRDQFNEYWSAHLQLNYVTDDYYFQDLGTVYSEVIANQLLNQADAEYHDEHWNFVGLLQGYQTLHLISQAGNPALNQYWRLPELDLNGDYADLWQNINFTLGAQSVNFAYESSYDPTTLEQPIGERLHLRPTLSRPWMGAPGYIIPQISLDSTSYAAQLAIDNDGESRPQFNASRNLPIIDVDSGLYFDRPIHWDSYAYLATLEPRLFYLYVPYMNQDKYPNFDSELLPFTFPQLFDVNRFTSYDRLENANQFSFGLTSRILNSNTTQQKFKWDMGFGYYLESPRVCLDASDCANSTYQYISPNSHITPLIGQVTVYPWTDWSATGSYAYDMSLGKSNNAQIGINYNHHHTEVFTMNYLYVREQNGDPTDAFNFSNSTNLLNSGIAWPLNEHWSGLAYAQYNLSKERPDTFYGGLQYDSCCWILRVIASRSFANQSTTGVNVFKNAYYVQLQLKSLGNIGTSPGSLLTSTLPGLRDVFQ